MRLCLHVILLFGLGTMVYAQPNTAAHRWDITMIGFTSEANACFTRLAWKPRKALYEPFIGTRIYSGSICANLAMTERWSLAVSVGMSVDRGYRDNGFSNFTFIRLGDYGVNGLNSIRYESLTFGEVHASMRHWLSNLFYADAGVGIGIFSMNANIQITDSLGPIRSDGIRGYELNERKTTIGFIPHIGIGSAFPVFKWLKINSGIKLTYWEYLFPRGLTNLQFTGYDEPGQIGFFRYSFGIGAYCGLMWVPKAFR